MPWTLTDDYRAQYWPKEPRLSAIRAQRAAEVDAYLRQHIPECRFCEIDTHKILGHCTSNNTIEQIVEEAIVNWFDQNGFITFDYNATGDCYIQVLYDAINKLEPELQGRIYRMDIFQECHQDGITGYVQVFFENQDDALLVKMAI